MSRKIANQQPWFTDYPNIVNFARHLVREEGFTADQLLGVLEHPNRWSEEFERFSKTARTSAYDPEAALRRIMEHEDEEDAEESPR